MELVHEGRVVPTSRPTMEDVERDFERFEDGTRSRWHIGPRGARVLYHYYVDGGPLVIPRHTFPALSAVFALWNTPTWLPLNTLLYIGAGLGIQVREYCLWVGEWIGRTPNSYLHADTVASVFPDDFRRVVAEIDRRFPTT